MKETFEFLKVSIIQTNLYCELLNYLNSVQRLQIWQRQGKSTWAGGSMLE